MRFGAWVHGTEPDLFSGGHLRPLTFDIQVPPGSRLQFVVLPSPKKTAAEVADGSATFPCFLGNFQHLNNREIFAWKEA